MKTKLFIITLCIIGMMVTGCLVIWTDDVFIATVGKVVDANDLYMISDPCYLEIGSGESRTKNDKIKAGAIIGGVPVSVESK
jgi:hypothetical protein